jgi:serine/threonine protein kinase/tetratricopeptide (TPR) repeat protein
VKPIAPEDPTGSTEGLGLPFTAPPQLERGASVGRYVVLDQIGAGGMGVVYKAYDPDLNRAVALKLLLVHDNDPTGVHRDRLLREAQALGQLSHPNVLAIYDVGSFRSHVFIATEFVEGQTVRSWLKEKRQPSEILEVFLAAGQGLQAAHRAGLVHRDFKPDNVIVGSDGRVRVLDFGLARAARDAAHTTSPPSGGSSEPDLPLDETVRGRRERPGLPASPAEPLQTTSPSLSSSSSGSNRLLTPLTRIGSVIGTPRFMAPEQYLGGGVDARADQFSFCVSLYFALYDQMPFAASSIDELREAVLTGRISEAPPDAKVPRWLRQVLLRGLATHPDARYPSMDALLQALRADPRLARASWLRAAALMGLVSVAALGWGVAHQRGVRACAGAERNLTGVWDHARRSAIRAAFRKSGRPYAEAAFGTVERAFDSYARAWAAMHTDTCEATQVRGEQSQEMLDLRMSCLAERLTQLKTLSDLYAAADGSVVERAAQSAESLPGLEACADTAALRAPLSPPPDVQTRRRVDEVRQQVARAGALGLAGRLEEAIRVSRVAQESAEQLKYPPLQAEAQLQLGKLLGEHGEYADSARTVREAFVAALAGHHEEVGAQAATELIQASGDRQAHYEDGDHWAKVAEALVGRMKRKDELYGALYTKRARLREREGKFDDALHDGTAALALIQRTLGPDHYNVAETYSNLAHIYFYQAKYAEALDSYQRGSAILMRTLGPDHPGIANTMVSQAAVYGVKGEHERALAILDRACAILARVQADSPELANIHNNMGNELLALGRPREALERYQLALDDWQKRIGSSHETVSALDNMGDAELALGKPNEALRYYQQSLAMCEKTLGPTHAWCGIILGGMGEAYRQLHALDDALPRFERSISVIEKAFSPKHPALAVPLLGLGRIALDRHAAASARPPLERALAIAESQPGDALQLANIRFALAQSLFAIDRSRATQLASQARDAYRALGAQAKKPLSDAESWLAGH